MKAIYHIRGLCPRTDIDIGRCGFGIDLHPLWKEAVALSGLTQENVNTGIKNMHRSWLDGCGYDSIFDPDRSAMDDWEARKLGKKIKNGPNSRPLYDSHSIRVQWGEWGPEHISVPGNACGLDIGCYGFCVFPDGRTLDPHNIDSLTQAHLLLVVFTFFAETLMLSEPIPKAPETNKDFVERVRAMSSKERVGYMVSAGINRPDGRLTERYRD